ncbi:hypothetical protein B0H13DRAFT_2167960, partial [Mycena leptocephala]
LPEFQWWIVRLSFLSPLPAFILYHAVLLTTLSSFRSSHALVLHALINDFALQPPFRSHKPRRMEAEGRFASANVRHYSLWFFIGLHSISPLSTIFPSLLERRSEKKVCRSPHTPRLSIDGLPHPL